MTQRTIFSGMKPTVIIQAVANVSVEGWEKEQVRAETSMRGGLRLETQLPSEIGRARAVVGDHVLFDLRLKLPGKNKKDEDSENVKVQFGANGKVWVPVGSRVKVYAGNEVMVNSIQGTVDIYTGGNVSVHDAQLASHISAGGSIDLECRTVEGKEAIFEAGGNLRCNFHDLYSARIFASDLGSDWEGVIGSGETILHLKAGGDVILVTDQIVHGIPPDFLPGQAEKPE